MTKPTSPPVGAASPDPPAKTLKQIYFDITGQTMITRRLKDDTPWAARFREFATASLADLDSRAVGSASDLGHLYAELEIVQSQIRELAAHVQTRDGEANPRSWSAALNVLSATQFVNASLLLHIRENVWYENSVLILLRTALEQVARAVYLMVGTKREASDWSDGIADPRPSKTVPVLKDTVAGWWPNAAAPDVIYGWLCDFTHFSRDAVIFNHANTTRRLTHEDGFAAVQYVAWLSMVVAQRIIGEPEALWPTKWPASLPWAGRT